MASFTMDYSEAEALTSAMDVTEIVYAYRQLKANTRQLQQVNNETLAVTIRSRPAYNYLYFPDDGSNTLRHAGGQHFFQSGAEESADQIIDLCVSKLIENF